MSELSKVKKRLKGKKLGAKERKKLLKTKKALEKHEDRVTKQVIKDVERYLCNIPEYRAMDKNRTKAFCEHLLYTIDYFHKQGIEDVRLAAICGVGHVKDMKLGFFRKVKGLATRLRKEKIDVKVTYI